MRKLTIVVLATLVTALAIADSPTATPRQGPRVTAEQHRYLIERTFPAGALEQLTPQTKAQVNATNAKFGVHWVKSYANADKTKTFCIYEGPNELAIRSAAAANKLPVDAVIEVPVTLSPN